MTVSGSAPGITHAHESLVGHCAMLKSSAESLSTGPVGAVGTVGCVGTVGTVGGGVLGGGVTAGATDSVVLIVKLISVIGVAHSYASSNKSSSRLSPASIVNVLDCADVSNSVLWSYVF